MWFSGKSFWLCDGAGDCCEAAWEFWAASSRGLRSRRIVLVLVRLREGRTLVVKSWLRLRGAGVVSNERELPLGRFGLRPLLGLGVSSPKDSLSRLSVWVWVWVSSSPGSVVSCIGGACDGPMVDRDRWCLLDALFSALSGLNPMTFISRPMCSCATENSRALEARSSRKDCILEDWSV